MKALSVLLLISGLVISSSFTFPDGKKIPSAAIRSIDGKTFNTADFSNDGKPMIICVWETTCKPSVLQLENLTEVYSDWQKETGVKIVAISVDDARSSNKVKPMVTSKGWEYEMYLDSNQDFKRAMNITFCPFTCIVDGNGEIVWQKTSYVTGDEETMYELIKKVAKGEKISD